MKEVTKSVKSEQGSITPKNQPTKILVRICFEKGNKDKNGLERKLSFYKSPTDTKSQLVLLDRNLDVVEGVEYDALLVQTKTGNYIATEAYNPTTGKIEWDEEKKEVYFTLTGTPFVWKYPEMSETAIQKAILSNSFINKQACLKDLKGAIKYIDSFRKKELKQQPKQEKPEKSNKPRILTPDPDIDTRTRITAMGFENAPLNEIRKFL